MSQGDTVINFLAFPPRPWCYFGAGREKGDQRRDVRGRQLPRPRGFVLSESKKVEKRDFSLGGIMRPPQGVLLEEPLLIRTDASFHSECARTSSFALGFGRFLVALSVQNLTPTTVSPG